MGLKLLQLLKKQPPYIINRANNILITKAKESVSVKGFPAVHAHTIDPESENKGHQTQIVVIDTPKIRNPDFITGHVKVSCSCEFFMYNSEYALHKWGAANIRYSNGEPATFTNSDNFPILCKHLYALGYKVYINARKKT